MANADRSPDAAIDALMKTKSWPAMREVLDHSPILTSDEVIKWTVNVANAAARRGDHPLRVWYLLHASLLVECRESGVESGIASWTRALEQEIANATSLSMRFHGGDSSVLDDAIEGTLWGLLGARRQGPLDQFWDPLLQSLRFLIQEAVDKHGAGSAALSTLLDVLREDLNRVEVNTPSWAERAMTLVGTCAEWFETYGEVPALEEAIELAKRAIEVRSSDPAWESDLGRLLLWRFEIGGDEEDLTAAITAQRRVLGLVAVSNVDLRAVALDRLGMSLRTSFERYGTIEALDEAVMRSEEAVRISPPIHPFHPAHLGNLASALHVRFLLTREDEDRRRAVELLRSEVEKCRPSHPQRPDALANLAAALTADADVASREELAEAITNLKEAIEIAGDRHVRWIWELALAKALFAMAGQSSEQSLELERRLHGILARMDATWPERATALALLGELQAATNSDEAVVTMAEAVDVGFSTKPGAALAAAQSWRQWATRHHRVDELVKASSRSLDVLDSLGSRQPSFREQLQWRQLARSAVEDAAFALAAAGELDAAVEHLERGRASTVRRSLGPNPDESGAFPMAAVGPGAIHVVASLEGGIALISAEKGITAMPLPGLTLDRVLNALTSLFTGQDKRTLPGGAVLWRQSVESVTRWMYDTFVAPLEGILRDIGPNVTLLLDGLVAMLPWGAAWTPDRSAPEGRRYLIDLPVDLTIAPTARLQAVAKRQAAASISENVLIVAPTKDTENPLENVDLEVAAVSTAFPGAIELRSEATVSAVLREMRDADIVHFACHGQSLPTNPTDSYLVLSHGEKLHIADLAGERYRARRLVVLSACETGASGVIAPTEVVGFPTAFLRLGFGGVVGSLWPVRDDVTALLMRRFYRELTPDRNPSAALAAAQRWLRHVSAAEAGELLGQSVDDGDHISSIESWATFIFAGA